MTINKRLSLCLLILCLTLGLCPLAAQAQGTDVHINITTRSDYETFTANITVFNVVSIAKKNNTVTVYTQDGENRFRINSGKVNTSPPDYMWGHVIREGEYTFGAMTDPPGWGNGEYPLKFYPKLKNGDHAGASLTFGPDGGGQSDDDMTPLDVSAFSEAMETTPTSAPTVAINPQDYKQQTLTDPQTGISVTGKIVPAVELTVQKDILHTHGDVIPECLVCGEIDQSRRAGDGDVLAVYDIAMEENTYTDSLEITVPVDAAYNGKTVTLLHCRNGTAEKVNLIVEDGFVSHAFDSLSPFIVMKADEAGGDPDEEDTGETADDAGVDDKKKANPVVVALPAVIVLAAGLGAGVMIYRKRKSQP